MPLGKMIIDLTGDDDDQDVIQQDNDSDDSDEVALSLGVSSSTPLNVPTSNPSPDGKRKRERKRKKRKTELNASSQKQDKKTKVKVQGRYAEHVKVRHYEQAAMDDFYFVDNAPETRPPVLGASESSLEAVASPVTIPQHQASSSKRDEELPTTNPNSLLLPPHVQLDEESATNLPPILEVVPVDGEELDSNFIREIDADDRALFTRYFSMEADSSVVKVCKKCGEQGHTKADCPNKVCFTCGVWNEHSAYNCPIRKVCFKCGMHGHVQTECPNPRNRGNFCSRCGSSHHLATECPTLWRIYNYHTTEKQDSILQCRASKRNLKLGEGGEGFVASDDWCYNCGRPGHLGDDCTGSRMSQDGPREDTIFGRHLASGGPFNSMASNQASMLLELQSENLLANDRFPVPLNVGKQGKQKARERAQKAAARQEIIDIDAEDDWFDRRANTSAPSNIIQKAKNSVIVHKAGLATRLGDYRPPPMSSGPSFNQPGRKYFGSYVNE